MKGQLLVMIIVFALFLVVAIVVSLFLPELPSGLLEPNGNETDYHMSPFGGS